MKLLSKPILIVFALLYGITAAWAGGDASLPVLPDAPGANFDPALVNTIPGGKTRGFKQTRLPPAPRTKAEIGKAVRSIVQNHKKTRGMGGSPTDNRLRAYINFQSGSAIILPEFYTLLNNWGASLAQDASGVPVEIAGHTDSRGTYQYNVGLSEQRANTVKNYLVSHFQIDPSLLQAVPYGPTRPYLSNSTVSGRAVNRRVEFEFFPVGTVAPPEKVEHGLDDEETSKEKPSKTGPDSDFEKLPDDGVFKFKPDDWK